MRDFGGAGPIALLHHGNGFSAGTWRFVAERLTTHYRVFAIDARGHGDSDAQGADEGDDLSKFVADLTRVAGALCEKEGRSTVALGVGSSLGGVVTAIAQSRSPGLFERIALFDPPIIPSVAALERFGIAPVATGDRKQELIDQTLRKRTRFPSREAVQAAWRGRGVFASWPDAAFELFVEECMRATEDGGRELKCAPRVEAHIYATNANEDVLQFAPAVQIPVLYVHAGRGHFNETLSRKLAGLFPNGRFESIDAGHLLPVEAPEQVVGRLLAFARS